MPKGDKEGNLTMGVQFVGVSLDPDALARRHVELLHEVCQLRERRNSNLAQYEELRARMQKIVATAEILRDMQFSETPYKFRLLTYQLLQEILDRG